MKELSNFELNKAIAKLRGYNDAWLDQHGAPDYCNNWNDLMPLVVEHEISFYPILGGGYGAEFYSETTGDNCISNDNPQRALAECLLKVLQGASQ